MCACVRQVRCAAAGEFGCDARSPMSVLCVRHLHLLHSSVCCAHDTMARVASTAAQHSTWTRGVSCGPSPCISMLGSSWSRRPAEHNKRHSSHRAVLARRSHWRCERRWRRLGECTSTHATVRHAQDCACAIAAEQAGSSTCLSLMLSAQQRGRVRKGSYAAVVETGEKTGVGSSPRRVGCPPPRPGPPQYKTTRQKRLTDAGLSGGGAAASAGGYV